MVSAFIQEQRRYSKIQLKEVLDEKNEDRFNTILKKLKEYGVLKLVKAGPRQRNMTELLENDIEIVDIETAENEYYYVFTYVGIIIIADKILKCYPKYIINNKEPIKELKQIIKVLEKYSNSKEQILRMFNGNNTGSFNLLALQMFLLTDYYENGIYINLNSIIEENGEGEIFWEKTINESFAIIKNNKPYYLELKTRKNIENENDLFKKLHEIILTQISNKLKRENLLDLFEYTEVELTNDRLSDLGEEDYLLYRIENELNTQFNTRKQLVLKAMYTYIKENGHLYDLDCFSMFGTNSFNLVWQSVCEEILDNKLKTPISDINLPIKSEKKMDLIDVIEKPFWSIPNKNASETLEPDIISIYKDEEIGKWCLAIFDAKYYNTVLEEGGALSGVPGIESVTKQYLYQLAYNKFIIEHRIQIVYNCFLMPIEGQEYKAKGYVELNIFNGMSKGGINLEDIKIKIRMVPAEIAYRYYLKGDKIKFKDLNLADDGIKTFTISYGEKHDNTNNIQNNIYNVEKNNIDIFYKDENIFKQNEGRFKTESERNIYYYGEEFGYMHAINQSKINTLNDLFEKLLQIWDIDTIFESENLAIEYDRKNNPTYGQDVVTAYVIWALFGGTVNKIRLNNDRNHYFNIINKHYIDFTKDQFDLLNISIEYEPNEVMDLNYLIYNKELLNKYRKIIDKINRV